MVGSASVKSLSDLPSGPAARLYTRAVDFIRRSAWKANPTITEHDADRFVRVILADQELATELFGREYMRRCAVEHLTRAQVDINGLPSAGQTNGVAQNQSAGAEQPDGDGRGHPSGDALVALASPSPTHQPGRSARGLASILSVQPVLRAGLLFVEKTSDGRAWGDVGWHELDGMDRDGAVARIIKRRFGLPIHADRFVKLAEHLTENQFREVLDEARAQNDAA